MANIIHLSYLYDSHYRVQKTVVFPKDGENEYQEKEKYQLAFSREYA